MNATTEATDKQRLEAAVRRLPLLPERKTEVDRTVTGLTFVIRSVSATKDEDAAIIAKEDAAMKEREAAGRAAAAQVGDLEWAFLELTEAWERLSDATRETLVARFRDTGNRDGAFLDAIEYRASICQTMAAAADALEHPDRPLRATPLPENPALVLAKHAARAFTRLTGKQPPHPRPGEKIVPGPFYYFLEDILRAAHITASVETYIRKIAEK